MSTVVIQPENCRASSGASTRNSKSNPVSDGKIFDLAHSPDIVSLNVVLQVDFSTTLVYDTHSSSRFHLKSLIMRSVFLSLLCHESNIRHISHSFHIKLSILSAVFDNSLVNSSVRSIRNTTLSFLQLVVLVPHFSSITNDTWHTSINNNVRRNVQVSNSLVRINHSKVGTSLVAGVEISNDDISSSLVTLLTNRLKNGSNSIVRVSTDIL